VHCYYKHPGEEVRNTQGKGDVRGDGGYVVAPPSNGYEWIKGLVKDIPVWPIREKLDTVLSTCNQVQNGMAYVSKIFADSGNGGHNATFRAACKLAETGLTEVEVFGVLYQWNRTNTNPQWSQEELAHKAKDAIEAVFKKANTQLQMMDDCPGGVCSTGGDMRRQ
jgi:hypothetical protein